ncbi:YkuD_like domain containing protein [Rhabdaerophilaceae bacterium]
MKRSDSSRVYGAAVLLGGSLLLVGCNDEGSLPRNSRHWVALSPEIQSKMSEAGVSRHSPMLIRAFKKEGELEVWKADNSGEYKHVKTFPVCRWSGQLGPKKVEGDRQVPEGFYAITPQMLNPNSSFYLSFNIGYPNSYDRSLGRNGSLIMVHGACSSRGCFSMTDAQIADIYALARESFSGGQKAIQMQSFPFRFTPENLAKYRADEHLPFWKNLKEGSDHFEVTKRAPEVAVCGKKYVFNALGKEGARFEASAACPPVTRDESLVAAVSSKSRADEKRVAELVNGGAKALKRIYKDGDQHPSFKNTVYAYAGGTENVSRAANVPQTASRIADVSQPDALAFGHVDVPAESARGLTRQQLFAKAERVRADQDAAVNPPASAVATAPVPAAVSTTATRAAAVAPAARAAQPTQPVTATALVAEKPASGDKPAFYSRWLGSLSGLTASASEAAEQPAEPAAGLPTPPQRR